MPVGAERGGNGVDGIGIRRSYRMKTGMAGVQRILRHGESTIGGINPPEASELPAHATTERATPPNLANLPMCPFSRFPHPNLSSCRGCRRSAEWLRLRALEGFLSLPSRKRAGMRHRIPARARPRRPGGTAGGSIGVLRARRDARGKRATGGGLRPAVHILSWDDSSQVSFPSLDAPVCRRPAAGSARDHRHGAADSTWSNRQCRPAGGGRTFGTSPAARSGSRARESLMSSLRLTAGSSGS